jgi:hypothetical protein
MACCRCVTYAPNVGRGDGGDPPAAEVGCQMLVDPPLPQNRRQFAARWPDPVQPASAARVLCVSRSRPHFPSNIVRVSAEKPRLSSSTSPVRTMSAPTLIRRGRAGRASGSSGTNLTPACTGCAVTVYGRVGLLAGVDELNAVALILEREREVGAPAPHLALALVRGHRRECQVARAAHASVADRRQDTFG